MINHVCSIHKEFFHLQYCSQREELRKCITKMRELAKCKSHENIYENVESFLWVKKQIVMNTNEDGTISVGILPCTMVQRGEP